ncbi:MAG: 50S ribosomal protein L1 [Myxococcales bacterium]|nr:MAG: 50S ribosomal protein L1 [Myxococcales bacterium]
MAHRGKHYRSSRSKIDPTLKYDLDGGITLVKEANYAKFDESVDVAIRLGVNPKHSDQMVRGAVLLPHGTGKSVRVLVFAKGDKENEAKEAGADFVGGDDLAEKIKGGWFDFDKVVAAPDMMGVVGKIGKILGPRGLMPNPKVGTVTQDVGRTVRELKQGRIEYRVDKAGIIHCPIGRKSFATDHLKENFLELLSLIMKARPSTVKGAYLKGVAVSTTMGPGVRLDVNSLADLVR